MDVNPPVYILLFVDGRGSFSLCDLQQHPVYIFTTSDGDFAESLLPSA